MKIVEIANPPGVEELIARFGAGERAFVLDSSQSNDGLGQWSFFGANPFVCFEGKEGQYREFQISN